jgi:hypothetical protein
MLFGNFFSSADFRRRQKVKRSAELIFVGVHDRRTDHLAYQQVSGYQDMVVV